MCLAETGLNLTDARAVGGPLPVIRGVPLAGLEMVCQQHVTCLLGRCAGTQISR